jgi:hypothetical protein
MSKTRPLGPDNLVTEERLEIALQVLTSIVSEHGEKHLPLLQMVEGQLEQIHAKKAARERVRRLSAAIGQVV